MKAALAGLLLLGSSVTGARALDMNDLVRAAPPPPASATVPME
jgi:hypothetical protein